MDRADIIADIAKTLADVIDEEAVVLNEGTEAEDVDGWDSIAHVKLMIALEDTFNLRFESAEIAAPQNVGELVDLVQRKLS